jgi:hypothetical protein
MSKSSEPNDWPMWFIAILIIIFGIALIYRLATPAHARDLGQWENSDPTVRAWYKSLMQPDVPTASCCGEADAYYCDEIHVREGKTSCAITDERDDAPLGRPHVDIGTEIEIPDYKLKTDRGNPTGHAVVFLSRSRYVYCFVQGGGA